MRPPVAARASPLRAPPLRLPRAVRPDDRVLEVAEIDCRRARPTAGYAERGDRGIEIAARVSGEAEEIGCVGMSGPGRERLSAALSVSASRPTAHASRARSIVLATSIAASSGLPGSRVKLRRPCRGQHGRWSGAVQGRAKSDGQPRSPLVRRRLATAGDRRSPNEGQKGKMDFFEIEGQGMAAKDVPFGDGPPVGDEWWTALAAEEAADTAAGRPGRSNSARSPR